MSNRAKKRYALPEALYAKVFSEKLITERVLEHKEFVSVVQDEGKRYTDVYIWKPAPRVSSISQSHTLYIQARAVCSYDDEWNDDIGIMVALCKVYKIELPKWMYNKEEK